MPYLFREQGKGNREQFELCFLASVPKHIEKGKSIFMGYIVFKELQVWQRAMELVEEVYSLVKLLPKEEDFGLKAQLRRAATSVPSNIAEGNSRHTAKEYVNFLSIARGSNSEVLTQLLICNRLGYLNEQQTDKAINLIEEISKMLNAMIIKLSK